MSLTLKFLEKQAGTLSRTAIANLGGIITSETVGYTGVNCSVLHTATGNHHWTALGNAATSYVELQYTSSAPCVEGHKIYVIAIMTSPDTISGSYALNIEGTTGGQEIFKYQDDPIVSAEYIVSGIVTLDDTYTGNLVIGWRMSDSGGTNGEELGVYNWTAIDLTAQFGAGDEPDAADLDDFFAWRWDGWTNPVRGLHNAYGYGDDFFYASKIASHGLEFNDVVAINEGSSTDMAWSNVFPLNDDWIITSTCNILAYYDPGTAAVDLQYWTKTDYTSRMLAKSLNLNVRDDIEGGATLALRGDSSWTPKLGMTAIIYDGTEILFSGRISQISITDIDESNWRCDCTIASMLATLQWNVYQGTDLQLQLLGTTGSAIEQLVLIYANQLYSADVGGQCFWHGCIDDGNSSLIVRDTPYKTIYEICYSLCKSSGMILSVTPDRRITAIFQARVWPPSNAPRNITDAVSPTVWDMRYREDISQYGNNVIVRGGYDSAGVPVISGYYSGSALTDAIYAGNSSKSIIINDSAIANTTDAETAAEYYYNRFGKVIPGEFSFTTTDLDYRPGQKISVDIDRLGMTAAKTMNIDSVNIYDADGINLLAKVTCSNRDSTDYAAAPNPGSTSYLADLSNKVSQSVSAITQQAGTFTPTLSGNETAGTWTYTYNDGYYVRLGNLCFINIDIKVSTISGSPTGSLKLSGLPYASTSGPGLLTQTDGINWGTDYTYPVMMPAVGEKYATFQVHKNNGSWNSLDVSGISAGDSITVTGCYQIVP